MKNIFTQYVDKFLKIILRTFPLMHFFSDHLLEADDPISLLPTRHRHSICPADNEHMNTKRLVTAA